MKNEKIYSMLFSKVYPLLIAKAERKNRTAQEVYEITEWLTGYTAEQIAECLKSDITYGDFFLNAPELNPNRKLIAGSVCGIRVENIEEPLMQKIRYLDKLVDELAKGKATEKILRKWYQLSQLSVVYDEKGGRVMKELLKGTFTGERALFMAQDKHITGSVFEDGESPLKHSKNIYVENSQFKWKYPFWYSENISVKNCTFYEMGRAGIWYTNNISVSDCEYIAPKGFRRCDRVSIKNVNFPNAAETLWQCRNVKLNNVTAKGDYLAMNCEDMEIDGLNLDGNYSFDGAKNITIRNSRLMSKDAFWNSENITAEKCYINGEYLGWNSKNLTLINCTIESLQGLCFCENLTLIGCKLVNTTLAFEYSSVNADITGTVDSIKNPLGGVIKCDNIGELIMEEDKVDIGKTEFIIKNVSVEV